MQKIPLRLLVVTWLIIALFSFDRGSCFAQGGPGLNRVANWNSLSQTVRQLFDAAFTPTIGDQIRGIAERYPGGTKFVIQVTATGLGDKPDFDRMVRYGTPTPFFGRTLFFDKIYIRDAGPAQNWPEILVDNFPCRLTGQIYSVPAYNEHIVDTVFIRLDGIAKSPIIVKQIRILGPTPLVAYRNEPLQLRLHGYQSDGWQGEMYPASARWSILSKVSMLNARGMTEYATPGSIVDGRLLVTANVGSVEVEARIGDVAGRLTIPVAGRGTPPTPPGRPYIPKPEGPKCSDRAAAYHAECNRILKHCTDTNCRKSFSDCRNQCGSCGAAAVNETFDDKWCQLHPSYLPAAQGALNDYVSATRQCVDMFLAGQLKEPFFNDQKIGFCQDPHKKRLEQRRKAAVEEACRARCANDGRKGVVKVMQYRCECE